MTAHSSQDSEETLSRGVPHFHGLHKHRIHRNSRTTKKEIDGPAGAASAPSAQSVRLGSVLLGHCALQLVPPHLRTGHWKVGCVAGAHQDYRLDYLQGQGRLSRPPRDGSLRIHLSWGPLGRTVGTESLVLAGCLPPAAVIAHLTDTGLVAGHQAAAQPKPRLAAWSWVRLRPRIWILGKLRYRSQSTRHLYYPILYPISGLFLEESDFGVYPISGPHHDVHI
jgi:hypothetical protein